MRIRALFLAATLLTTSPITALCAGDATDGDRDGLDDGFEQSLIAKFAPSFRISSGDCDAAPAEFEPNSAEPRVRAKNGTIYAQVFPVPSSSGRGALRAEIHYYHLWSQDCGRMSHPLDAESVSVLVRSEVRSEIPSEKDAEGWRAEYWYAAAHENTLCDMSGGAKATALGAIDRGPEVWVSRDKHASFFQREFCSKGCGKDVCDGAEPLKIRQIVNIGEPGSPLNGASWSASNAWPLAAKMLPVFTEALLARCQRLLPLNSCLRKRTFEACTIR